MIVAIPSDKDPVWKISSEKIPHLTLCYLGGEVSDDTVIRMTQYLDHIAETSMRPFGMGVKRRGTLGEKQADVLFFHEDHADELRDIRSYFLANDEIYNAYHSTDQYEKWLPHLTLGYPETPAKPDTREYPGIDWVSFDRIALWTGDYEGATFQLTHDRGELSMSETLEDILAHFGTKGMKWGVRKDKGHEGERAPVKKIAKADAKFEKDAKSLSTLRRSYNMAVAMTNDLDVARINNKPKYKNADFTRDTPLRRQYYKEHQDAFVKNWQTQLDRGWGTNASGTRKITVYQQSDGNWEIQTSEVAHADGENFKVRVNYDPTGHILSLETEGGELMEESVDAADILEHFGVKGMKWGVTKEHVSTLKEARERTRDAIGRKDNDHKDKSAVREFRKRADKQGVRTLGDKELKQLVARADLENKYRELRQKEKEASRAFLKAVWDGFGKEIVGAIIREGVAYKFRGGNNSGPSKATVIDGRVLEGASRALGRFASAK